MEKLFVYLTDLSSAASYGIIFGILVACGLGFPLPEDIPLVASGYLIWDGTMKWLPAIAVTIAGVLIGDTILFFIGHKLGLRILQTKRWQTVFQPSKVKRVRAYFRKYGDKIVFFARFVAGFRAVAFFMAGAMKMPFRRFLLLDALAALLSVPIWIVIGYGLGHYLGDQIADIMKWMKQFKTVMTVVIFSIIAIFAVRTYIKFRRARSAAAARAA